MTPILLPAGFRVRPGTWDAEIFRAVCLENEYRLPNPLPAGAIVLDVGAHIGSFAFAAHAVGAAAILCYEPHPENFALLAHNVGLLPRARACRRAIWHAAERPRLRMEAFPGPNTGGAGVFAGNGQPVPALGLDRAIAAALEFGGGDRLHLLKLDCEGAEYPILADADLARVDALCGELHDGPLWRGRRWLIEDGVALLARQGFAVEVEHHGQQLAHFWARRPG